MNHSTIIGTMIRSICRCLVLGCVATFVPAATAQLSTPETYSGYYSNTLQQYRRPPVDPRRYTYDKYFYHSPAVSPYMNLLRQSNPYVPAYQTYVRPELERRSRTAQSLVSAPQTHHPSSYYNGWYGNRQALGLPH